MLERGLWRLWRLVLRCRALTEAGDSKARVLTLTLVWWVPARCLATSGVGCRPQAVCSCQGGGRRESSELELCIEIELKSLILAQIERWRHALHMQVERGEGATSHLVANG